MKKLLILIAAVISFTALQAKEQRNFLTGSFTRDQVKAMLVQDDSWIKFPAYKDRKAWEALPAAMREQYVANGEKYLNYTWPVVRATDYLAFTRTGDREIMQKPMFDKLRALQVLVMAELVEGKGRFMDDIVNGVFSICEMGFWGLSAHFYMYVEDEGPGKDVPTVNFPDITNPIIDLWVGEVAADLAWTYYFFKDEFEKISPVLPRRIEHELRTKVLEPYYTRNDYWWITGWKRGEANNWNPWCNYNIMNAMLIIEKDQDKKADALYKSMKSVDLFFNSYPNDGGCDEGPSYWGAAGGKAFDYLDLLYRATDGGISIFDKPLVKDIGRYIYRVYISQAHYFINFADAPTWLYARSGTIYRYGERIGDKTMAGFGAFLLREAQYGTRPINGLLATALEDLFTLDGWEKTTPVEPLIGEYYFPDLQIALARERAGSNEGFYFAAKGGHNGETHNHNDVGSGIVFYDGYPVFVDAGVGTYTKETFGKGRYKIWTMQSTYHNLPLINGTPQSVGKQFAASTPKYSHTKTSTSFSVDIAKAYPPEAKVTKWVRGYALNRGKGVTISDDYLLSEAVSPTELHYLTPMECKITKPGVIELKNSNFTLTFKYNPALLKADVKLVTIEDAKLTRAWKSLNMIVLTPALKTSGKTSVELTAVK